MSHRRLPARPRGHRLRPRVLAAAVAAAAVVFAGCGPPPPQAPTAQADRLSDSLSMISQDCGEAFQITEFDGGPGALAPAAADARVRAHELAGVYRANPDWIYQGDTVRQIVALTVTRLRDCHLDRVARQLVRQARR